MIHICLARLFIFFLSLRFRKRIHCSSSWPRNRFSSPFVPRHVDLRPLAKCASHTNIIDAFLGCGRRSNVAR